MSQLKILIDECVDSRLAKTSSKYSIKTVFDVGWNGLKNGALLTKAQEHFDVFITVDRNLSTQQNLSKYSIAILVLSAKTNSIQDLNEVFNRALNQVHLLKKGKAIFVK